jgi:hypothetical protein
MRTIRIHHDVLALQWPVPSSTTLKFESTPARNARQYLCVASPRQLRRATTKTKVFMFHNKTNFEAALSQQFRVSENWRTGNSKRYPNDGRNAEAANWLRELGSQIIITDQVWNHLQALVSTPTCLAAISQPNRDVGFRTNPHDFTAWLENLYSNLTRGAE